MRIISVSDDAILATWKLLSSMSEEDLIDAGLSPLEIDDFCDVYKAVNARYVAVLLDQSEELKAQEEDAHAKR